ncbi:solute carrier family 22 member 2-like isoform X2 [Antennarius striatus]|uniref:solute carrier family 22 member 2-like isoform X2 n=1 Tax=Antennarius striatus TaxID=241820 RepID=UPI0035B2423F
MTTFDDLLDEAGNFGHYQKRIFAMTCLMSLPFASLYVGIVFQGYTPDHWCQDSTVMEMRQACGWSLEDSHRLTVPMVNSSGVLQHSSCEQYDVDWNNTMLTCDTQGLNLTKVLVIKCKDGWEYQYAGRNSLVTEFNLVCSDACFGRRIGILLSNILNVIAGFGLALTPNYVAILVIRGIFGFGVKGGWMTAYVMLTEIVGMKYRRTVGILFQMFFSVGLLILPLLAYFITDWRWLQAATTVPYIFFLSYYWLIPESPRWLISQKNYSKGLETMEAMAKENKRNISRDFETLTGDEEESSSSVSVFDLFRTPNMRKYTFILMFCWWTSSVVYQGLVLRVGISQGNIYIDFLLAGLVEFPAAFLILFTIERIGRRLPFAAANIIAGLSCFVTAFIPDEMFWFKTVTACLGRLGITMAFEMVMFINSELFPTCVRNLGVSVCSSLCDIGGIICPFLLYRLAAVWIELPLIVFGVFAFIAGGLILLLPETKGVPLPDTINDVEFPGRRRVLVEETK